MYIFYTVLYIAETEYPHESEYNLGNGHLQHALFRKEYNVFLALESHGHYEMLY